MNDISVVKTKLSVLSDATKLVAFLGIDDFLQSCQQHSHLEEFVVSRSSPENELISTTNTPKHTQQESVYARNIYGS